jgi:hypothetical protein
MLQKALEADDCSIFEIIAPGGTGKSAIVRAWLESIRLESTGTECLYAWQFSDQEDRTTSSSQGFFLDILQTSCVTRHENTLSESEQTKLLVEGFSQQRMILVLDSLEALQHQTTAPRGKLFDGAIKGFLTQVAPDEFKLNSEKIESRQPKTQQLTSES